MAGYWWGPSASRPLILAARVVLEGGPVPPAACMTALHDEGLLSVEIEGILNVFIVPLECLCMCFVALPDQWECRARAGDVDGAPVRCSLLTG